MDQQKKNEASVKWLYTSR